MPKAVQHLREEGGLVQAAAPARAAGMATINVMATYNLQAPAL